MIRTQEGVRRNFHAMPDPDLVSTQLSGFGFAQRLRIRRVANSLAELKPPQSEETSVHPEAEQEETPAPAAAPGRDGASEDGLTQAAIAKRVGLSDALLPRIAGASERQDTEVSSSSLSERQITR